VIKLASDLSLPLELVTESVAILARKRAGKSYTARKLAEGLLGAGQQVVIVDPKGDWWGIRSARSGRGPGLPVVILGGEHGDVPLEAGGGELVARMVVHERVSVLIDTSLFSKRQAAHFMADFLETAYRLKAQAAYRTPMMLVVDEADAIAPQRPLDGEQRMLGAASDIVRRGGQRGIGICLVTQRTAVLHKDVLTQCGVLILLRTTGSQDIAAIDDWIRLHGQPEEKKLVMTSLASLPTGTAWIWAPGWPDADGIFQKVEIGRCDTFDSGATPKPGERLVTPKTVADVDLEAFRREMASTIEKVKAEDPKELRRRIAELEREARAAAAVKPETVERVVEVPALTTEERDLLGRAGTLYQSVLVELGKVGLALEAVRGMRPELDSVAGQVALITAPRQAAPAPRQRPAVASPAPRPRPAPPAHSNGHGALPRGQRAVLLALAQSGGTATGSKAALLAGYSVRSSTMRNIASALRTAGYADGSITAQLRITPEGEAALGEWEPLPTGDELRQHWLAEMGGGAPRAILQALIDAYPRPLSREELGAASGYSADSSTLRNALSKLNTLGLITGRGDERRACEDLFQ
jgi:hypothetical protein